jgi:hypothetical protein
MNPSRSATMRPAPKPAFKWIIFSFSVIAFFGCQKATSMHQEKLISGSNATAETPPFNIEAILRGEGNRFGHIKFRQDNDVAKIIVLDTWVRDLEPNHEYLLQRAVDPINVTDGNCTSTNWLTLGQGLTPVSIITNDAGTTKVELWRDVSAVPTGSRFDIHFQIIDALSSEVVLNSDCYEYVVR